MEKKGCHIGASYWLDTKNIHTTYLLGKAEAIHMPS
jgi:hypothetical protein